MNSTRWLITMLFVSCFLSIVNIYDNLLILSEATSDSMLSKLSMCEIPISTGTFLPDDTITNISYEACYTSWDWSDFSQNMIATFLGFLLAILGEFIVDRIARAREKKQIKFGIINELSSIIEQIKHNISQEALFLPIIETSYWDGIVGGTKLDLINTCDWYTNVASIYSRIREINDWFRQKSEYALLSVSGNSEDSEKYKRISKVFESHLKQEVTDNPGSILVLVSSIKDKMSM